MGIAASEAEWFQTNETVCEAQYGACGCESSLITADDGTTSSSGTTALLACIAGTCTTSFGI